MTQKKMKSNDIVSLEVATRNDFRTFCMRAFPIASGGDELETEPYIKVVCDWLERVDAGEWKKLVLNLPPRHAKTILGTVCLAGWHLAHHPRRNVIIVSYNDELAKQIAGQVRQVVDAEWFKDAFPGCRLDRRLDRQGEFATTKGGRLFASHMGGVTGRGAHLIIIDDPHNIGDEASPKLLANAIAIFETTVESRLNVQREGRIVVIGQRIHHEDLSGHLIRRGDYQHRALPFVAEKDETYETAYGAWNRKTDDLLRPSAYSSEDVAHKRASRAFRALYQQDPEDRSIMLSAKDFVVLRGGRDARAGVVLSIDTAPGVAGSSGSFSVIQAWQNPSGIYRLIEQWRGRVPYSELLRQARHLAAKYQPKFILVENTGVGTVLIEDLKAKPSQSIVAPISPRNKSKEERMREVILMIKEGRVVLSEELADIAVFKAEADSFPDGNTDQMDAMTQYLHYVQGLGTIPPFPRVPGRPGRRIVPPLGGRYVFARMR